MSLVRRSQAGRRDVAPLAGVPDQPIALVGMPGAGKTLAAAGLARRLGRQALDLDAAVAADAGQPVADLLRAEGEPAFRVREAAALAEVLARPDPVVLATGGGTPMFHDGMVKLRAAATVVWLDAPAEVLVERTLQGDERPLLGNTRQEQLHALTRLAAERTATFAKAQRRVDASQAPDQVLRDVLAAVQAPTVLPVTFEGARHDVVVHGGHACDAAEAIAALAQGGRVALLVDEKVRAEALPLQAMLEARDVPVVTTEVPGGERVKDVRTAARLWQWLGEHGIDRGDVLVALGGGATTDVGGFAASTWLRGLRWVAMPTTVLAMADASIGAKTAIDLPGRKNAVGTFHAPSLVWLPLGALHTLPGRDFRAGLAEIAKIFAVLDADAWARLLADAKDLKRRGVEHLRPHLLRAIELKAAIVAGDPREGVPTGGGLSRALLNFGHTLGHALEAEHGFALRHGEAVALGMVAAAELSETMGLAPAGVASELRAGLHALDLPTRWEAHLSEDVLGRLDHDKKRRGASLAFVALHGIGRGQVNPCRVDQLTAMIRVLGTPPVPAVRGR